MKAYTEAGASAFGALLVFGALHLSVAFKAMWQRGVRLQVANSKCYVALIDLNSYFTAMIERQREESKSDYSYSGSARRDDPLTHLYIVSGELHTVGAKISQKPSTF